MTHRTDSTGCKHNELIKKVMKQNQWLREETTVQSVFWQETSTFWEQVKIILNYYIIIIIIDDIIVNNDAE